MRVERLLIENFRGIKHVHLSELKDTIIIAGANGSGKSCIFDAIRLLKSVYGGYQENEWQQWMAEFQINVHSNPNSFITFFQDRKKKLKIECTIRLHPNERNYLLEHGRGLIKSSVWKLIAPELRGFTDYDAVPLAAQYRSREDEVSAKTNALWNETVTELSQDAITASLTGNIDGSLEISKSTALETLFSNYIPGKLGLVDYHGPQRTYTRELVTGINLDLGAQAQNQRQHALYNYNNKYNNIKSEMAAAYIKELIAERAGVKIEHQNTFTRTLEELFETFFPDKRFLGPQAEIDGSLKFPVKTASGAEHDLNELSAGEKEILYGYLRIRNSAPRYSVILLDEPELHLNPKLVRGLPQFYRSKLGLALDNQIWLITHSDALLRDVVGKPEYSVFHMVSAGASGQSEQLHKLTINEDIEIAVLGLVGDLAAYRPDKDIIVFEGGGDSEFDKEMTVALFPEIGDRLNLISGGNKLRVRELHEILEEAGKKQYIGFRVFSITDRDAEKVETSAPRFTWGVYHIENYLLEPHYILKVINDLKVEGFSNEVEVLEKLRHSARNTLGSLVRHELQKFSNDILIKSIDMGCDPQSTDVAQSLYDAATRSIQRIDGVSKESLSLEGIRALETKLRTEFGAALAGDTWRTTFRGREILKSFVSEYFTTSYETVRNLIIARMKEATYKPPGMKVIVDEILSRSRSCT